MRLKKQERKTIKETELYKYPEQDNRVFGVSCKEGIFKTERYFVYKKNLREYVDRQDVHDVVIQVCDILDTWKDGEVI